MRRWPRALAWIVLWAAWAAAAHIAASGLGTPDVNAALGIAPLAIVAGAMLWQARRRWAWPIIGIAGAAACVWLWPELRRNVALLYYLQHVGAHLALAVFFGRTLVGTQEALITRLARMTEGQLSERKIRYTRKVTVAWTAFFVANGLLSSVLFVFAPVAVWSLYANVLTLPIVAAMFAAEFAVRQFALPAHERPGLAESIRAYRKARLGAS